MPGLRFAGLQGYFAKVVFYANLNFNQRTPGQLQKPAQMDDTQDFKSLQDQIQAALISTTRTSGQISSEDLAFQRSLNPELGTSLDEQSARLLALSSALLKSATSISELKAPVLEDADDVENNWRNVVDVLDSLLEKTDTSLDEYTGVIKRRESPFVEQVNLIWALIT